MPLKPPEDKSLTEDREKKSHQDVWISVLKDKIILSSEEIYISIEVAIFLSQNLGLPAIIHLNSPKQLPPIFEVLAAKSDPKKCEEPETPPPTIEMIGGLSIEPQTGKTYFSVTQLKIYMSGPEFNYIKADDVSCVTQRHQEAINMQYMLLLH